MVFGWLGYNWWGEGENPTGENSDGKSSEQKEDWIWIENTGGTLSQNDLEFFERKRHGLKAAISYADAVKASFERCKKDVHSDDDIRNEKQNKTTANELLQYSDYNMAKCLSKYEKTDRKRKCNDRYSPFFRHGKLSKADRELYTLCPCLNSVRPERFLNKSTEMKISNNDAGWKTVVRKGNHVTKMNFLAKFKAKKFVVDVGNEMDMSKSLLRISCPQNTKNINLKDVMDMLTVVKDIKIPVKGYDERLKVKYAPRKSVDNNNKMAIMLKQDNSQQCLKNQNSSTVNIFSMNKSCLRQLIQNPATRYVLGLERQPLSIEWRKTEVEEYLQNVYQVMSFVEQIVSGLMSAVYAVAAVETAMLEDFQVSEERKTVKFEPFSEFKRSSTRVVQRQRLDRRGNKQISKIDREGQRASLRKNKRRDNLKHINMSSFKKGKNKSKNRNFTAKKYSGRSGMRAC